MRNTGISSRITRGSALCGTERFVTYDKCCYRQSSSWCAEGHLRCCTDRVPIRRMNWKSVTLAVCFWLGIGLSAQQRPCNDAESQHAEMRAGTLRSWDALYKSYTSYRRCDDGAIAEGYSESVARILVDHWSTLPRLAYLARRDVDFRRFVLRHVDATLDTNDVEKIRTNAKTLCPAGFRTLCDDLRKSADAALEEDDPARRQR
jgi:hypothetical protein